MSNLLNTVDGRNALMIAQRFLLERRLSRHFRRTIQIDLEQYRTGGNFDLETMLGQMNPANDAEILMIYQLLGALGALQTTYSDMSYTVNAATGSDLTGDGTAAKPYASTWFLDNLPRRIAHKVKIMIVGNLDESTKDVVLDFDFVTRDACLSIFGVGAPTVIVDDVPIGAGAVSNLRALGGDVLDITTLAPINRNSFIRAKTGIDAGRTAPIYSAIAGTAVLTKNLVFANVVSGDTCQVIEPSVKWTISSLRSMCRGNVQYSNFDGRGCPLVIANLDIDFTVYTGTLLNTGNFSWKNDCRSIFSFVRLLDTIQQGAIIEGGEVNTYNAVDPDIDALSLCGIANLNNGTSGVTPDICGFTLSEDSGSTVVRITVRNSIVRAMHTRWIVLLDGGKETIEYGWAAVYQARETTFKIYRSIATGLDGGDNTGGGGIDCKNSMGFAQWITVIASDNVISLRGGCHVFAHVIGSDATFSVITYAGAWMYGRNTLEVETDAASGDPALDGFAGATTEAAGYQATVGLTTNDWPAINTLLPVGNSDAYILE